MCPKSFDIKMNKRKKKTTSEKIRKAASIKGAGLLRTGALVIAVVMAVGASSVLHLNKPAEEELNEALEPSYTVEQVMDMPPEPVAEAPVEKKAERKKENISAGSIFMYVAGYAVSFLASLLGKFAGPIAARITSWVIFAAVVFGVLCYALKRAFPDVQLKQLLPAKSTALAFLAIAAVIAVCELINYLYGSGYSVFVSCLAFALGLVIILVFYSLCAAAATRLPVKEEPAAA